MLDNAIAEQPHSAQNQRATWRSTWVSTLVNASMAALQVTVGIVAHSQALIADGIHSLSDLVADFVVMLAMATSKAEADVDHPYGHRRFENAASMVLGALLLAVGMGMVWQAALSIHTHINHSYSAAPVQHAALWVTLAAIVIKEGLFRYLLHVATRVRSSLLTANAWHARSDAASSIVVAAGLIGSLLGFAYLDPIAALIVGLMVARMGAKFFWNALQDLMDKSATQQQIEAITNDILACAGVRGVHDLKTRKTGDLLLLDVHLEVDGTLTVAQGHAIAQQVSDSIMQFHPVLHVMTHVDPV